MDSYSMGLLAGVAAGVVIVAAVKLSRRNQPMSVAEKAEFLSKRRARMLPVMAILLLTQQFAFFSGGSTSGETASSAVKISAWLVLSVLLLLLLSTKGFWFEPRAVRDLMDDENTRANRSAAMRTGFFAAMLGAIALYVLSVYEPLNGREAIHIVMTCGIGAALLRFAALERRAHQDA